jgi:hypothetical protein
VGEIEVLAEFRHREWMHAPRDRAAREQVRPGAPKFACARTREHESPALALDESMDLVEEIWNFLHLVDDDRRMTLAVVLRHPSFDATRLRGELRRHSRIEQIEVRRFWKLREHERGFSGPARPEQEATLTFRK